MQSHCTQAFFNHLASIMQEEINSLPPPSAGVLFGMGKKLLAPASCALAADEIVIIVMIIPIIRGGIVFPCHLLLLSVSSADYTVHCVKAAQRILGERAAVHHLNAVDGPDEHHQLGIGRRLHPPVADVVSA